MGFLKTIAELNKKIPAWIRFVIALMLLNIPPISYLRITGSKLDSLYVVIVFLLINIAALIAYFKLKTVEVEIPTTKIRMKR